MFRVGLNPYGIAYSVGLFGAGTARANPKPLGLNGFLDLVAKLGLAGVEIPVALLKDVSGAEIERVRARIHADGKYAILMHGIPWADLDGSLDVARRFGFPIVRLHLTAVLCGARGELGDEWPRVIGEARAQLKIFAVKAADAGIAVTIEDHQDLTSAELVEICGECGANVGVCLDTGNPLSVGEEPVAFARAVAPLVRHVHLKDYRVYRKPEGFSLVRCAIGEGVVPFDQIAEVLAARGTLPASIEPGALNGRYIRLLADDWWSHYSQRNAQSLAACLRTVWDSFSNDLEYRTPWEQDADADSIIHYEMDQLANSVANLSEMELMGG